MTEKKTTEHSSSLRHSKKNRRNNNLEIPTEITTWNPFISIVWDSLNNAKSSTHLKVLVAEI